MKLVNISNNQRMLYLFCRNENGQLHIEKKNSFFPYFYTPDKEGNAMSYDGVPLRKLLVSKPSEVAKNRNDTAYEADILFTRRYLIDKIDKIAKTNIKYAFIDIEVLTDELVNVNNANKPISCISIHNSIYGDIQTWYLEDYNDTADPEQSLIDDFIKYMKEEKFDLWLSWNVVFDYNYLYNRIQNFAEKISPIGQTRYGDGDVYYPAGISIVDYLGWFKKVTLNRDKSYALDAVAQKHLKEESIGKVDFSKLSPELKEKNRKDIERMMKLEEKFKLIPYFDEVRRLAKVEWEDMIWNSRTIDMLLLQEARKQKVVLPMKPDERRGTLEEKSEYEGAYREVFETGAHFNIGKYDLTSAYPLAITNFCLDPANLERDNEPVIMLDKDNNEYHTLEIEGNHFIQNPNALLPTVVKKLMTLKNEIKKKLSTLQLNSPEYKDMKIKYNAIKSLVNSAYGVFGNRFFRLYNKKVASATTFIVRSLLHYIKDKCDEKGYKIIYVDTDSCFIQSDDYDNKSDANLTIILNNFIKQWAKEKFNKDSIDIEFEYKGQFEKLLILTKCRYKGYLRTEKGIEPETKGIEAKRKDSTEFMKKFQTELIDKILDKESKENIIVWIKEQIIKIKESPIEDIAFPCKLGRKAEDYKNVPIFLRALRNTEGFEKKVGDPFYYIYIKPTGYETKTVKKDLIQTYDKDGNEKGFKNLTEKRLEVAKKKYFDENVSDGENITDRLSKIGIIRTEKIEIKGKAKDVKAFDEENNKHITKDMIDWDAIIQRNIYMKLDSIFEAMKWDIRELIKIEPKKKKTMKKSKKKVDDTGGHLTHCNQGEYIGSCKYGDKDCPALNKKTAPTQIANKEFEKIQKIKAQTKITDKFDESDVKIKQITFKEASKFIKDNHYSHTMPVTNIFLGFSYKSKLNCVIVYGTGACYRLRQSLPNPNVLELVRLFSLDDAPKNMESYCIGQSIKHIREHYPDIKILVSFADPSQGHVGYIYQATNWVYTGLTLQAGNAIYKLDGVKIHPRTLLKKYKTTSKKEVLEFLKRDNPDAVIEKVKNSRKHRYLYFVGNRKENREMRKNLKYEILPYPKVTKVTQDSSLILDVVSEEYDKIQEVKSKIKVEEIDLKKLEMKRLDFKTTKAFIVKNHYSHTIASSVKFSIGFYYKDELVTAVVYGCPVGRRVTQWLQTNYENCLELVRLFSIDGLPKNTESYCIGQSFAYLKENHPQFKYLISYADPNHGHVGYIYQASNWRYVGLQRRLLKNRKILIDGKRFHQRTLSAKHGSVTDANLKRIYGDRIKITIELKKHVYLMCLGNKKERREWYKKFPKQPYPKVNK